MNAAVAIADRRVDLLDAFRERAEARALLWSLGELDLHEAVDVLQHDAVACGLVKRVGQDRIQEIMAGAFAPHRRTERPADLHVAESQRQSSNDETRRPKQAPQSTCDAALYEFRTYGIAQLKDPNCRRRLGDLSTLQVRDLIAALMRLQPKYPAITDDLLLTLGEQL